MSILSKKDIDYYLTKNVCPKCYSMTVDILASEIETNSIFTQLSKGCTDCGSLFVIHGTLSRIEEDGKHLDIVE